MVINLLRHSSITFTKRNTPIFCLLLLWTALMPTGLFAQENASAHDAEAVAQHETHVTSAQALNVGYTFMRKGNNTRGNNVSKQAMQLVYTGQAYDSLTGTTTDCYYVFALQPKGFVIVAADDRVDPILGYSYDNNFAVANMPDHVRTWLGNYERQIEAVAKSNLQAEPTTQTKWARLKSGQAMSSAKSGGSSVGPLLTTQWGQGWPYNAMCPIDSLAGESYHYHCPTGCVATAFAQVMNYWKYPERGRMGKCGNTFLNEITYHWDSMDVNHIDEISKLMYNIGVVLETSYGPYSSGTYYSTGMLMSIVEDFFEFTFTDVEPRANHSDSSWITLIDGLLEDSIPIIYVGSASTIGHMWVCDGKDANGFYHMNWGWNGDMDGYYSVCSTLNGFTIDQTIDYLYPGWYSIQSEFDCILDPITPSIAQFVDLSYGYPDSFFWDFGDGGSSTLQNPIHEYANSGEYWITHIVCKDGTCDTIVVGKSIFKASFVWNGDTLSPHDGESQPLVLDYDMDGKQDFIISSTPYDMWVLGPDGLRDYICKPTTLYRNVDSTFDAIQLQHASSLPPAIIDIFNDNKPSVLLDGLYLRNTNGFLTNDIISTLQVAMSRGERFSVVDYNNDGRMDVMIGDTLYKNIGGGLFTPAYSMPFGRTWVDYDKDGDMDLFTNQGIRSSLYKNNGDGTFSIQTVEGNYYFTAITIDSISGVWFDAYDYGDVDGDGWLDVGGIGALYRGNNHFEVSNGVYGNICTDFTIDGLMDCISISSGIFENANPFIPHYPDFGTYANTPASLAFIDRDGDNRPDLLATGYCEYEGFYGNSTIVYDNNSNSENLPPTAPVGLNASVSGNNVLLSWLPSTDDHNSVAITYNIAVGTSPNTCDVYSPLSNLETGKRYAYNKGNAGNATLWKVNDLPNGTYYWRVQAIDNALAASAFSTVGTFTINHENLPPAMANFTKEGFVNQPLAFDLEDFTSYYCDPEHDSLQSVKICNMQGDGTLYLAGTIVSDSQIIPVSSLASLIFSSSQPGLFEIAILPNDGYHFSKDTTHILINAALFKQSQALVTENISALAWGDFDNDGDADLASNTGIWKNDSGTFVQVYTPTVEASSVQWVDANNDGLLDCLFDMTICLNQGSGVFSQQPSLTTSSGMKTSCMDLNKDNHPDIIISADQTSTVFLNLTNGYSLDSIQSFTNNGLIGSIAVGDYDRDGDEDVIMVENETWNVQLLKNNDGTLINAETPISNYNCGSSDWGDYDRDGDLDFIGTTDNTGLKIYSNDGLGYFYEVFTGQFPIVYGGFVKWYDYDNDGYLDILMGGLGFDDAPVTFLFRNNQGLEFVKVDETNLPVLSNPNCAIGDYDQDGYGDIAISGTDESGESHIFIYHNNMGSVSPVLQTQSSPQDLTATVSGSTVHLSWSDTIEGHSYNVYVRKATDSTYIVSPLANTQTGERLVSKMGNAGLIKSLDIHSLQEGSYLWSVQSVDGAYHGNPFASEQSFEIVCAEPIYTDIYDTVHAVCAWLGSYYNSTGIYSRTFESSSGCDSIVRFHLTVDSLEKGIVYVTQTGSGDKSGYSWDNAMDDLQMAINTSVNRNAVVWVAEGIYTNEDGGQAAFVIPSTADVYIYGGFEGSEPADYDLTLRNLRQHETILDGLKKMHVIYKELSIYNTVIDGFTIQNGYGEYGGGIYVNTGYGGSTPMNVLNCIIRDNLCSMYGGGYNGGLGGNPLASATNCLIEHNRAWQGGAAMSVTLYNSTVVYNTADYSESYGNVDGSAYNSIIWGNTPGDGMHFQSFAYNCAIQYALLGNIDENCFYLDANNDGEDTTAFYVRFVDPENGDFRLSTGSACINKGTMDTTGFGLPMVDLQGLPRVLDGRIDMGAYEYYPVPVVETYDTICEGNRVTFYGTEYTVEGIYTVHTNPNPMQDTMYVLHLMVNPTDSADFAETACESFTWEGTTFTSSGDYTKTFTNANGCDSVVTLHLIIFHADSADFAETACESFTWEGTTYTSSGDYTKTLTNANGCDSVVTLHLTIFPADSADFAETACGSYEWNGQTYTESGDYTQTLTNANGCDSVVTLHLTINQAVSSEFAVETADSCYSWNGHLYCESGDYTQTLTAANGCDSVVTLHLTITVGIDDHNGFAFNVYPNPTNGIVNVQCTMHNGQVGAMAFHVFDAYGKLVDIVAADTHGSSEQTTQIDLSGFAAGVYFVKAVANGNVVAVRKVVKR
jgi:PKD repeat protein